MGSYHTSAAASRPQKGNEGVGQRFTPERAVQRAAESAQLDITTRLTPDNDSHVIIHEPPTYSYKDLSNCIEKIEQIPPNTSEFVQK